MMGCFRFSVWCGLLRNLFLIDEDMFYEFRLVLLWNLVACVCLICVISSLELCYFGLFNFGVLMVGVFVLRCVFVYLVVCCLGFCVLCL